MSSLRMSGISVTFVVLSDPKGSAHGGATRFWSSCRTLWNVGKGSEPMFRRRYVELRQFMAERERLVLDLRAGRGQ